MILASRQRVLPSTAAKRARYRKAAYKTDIFSRTSCFTVWLVNVYDVDPDSLQPTHVTINPMGTGLQGIGMHASWNTLRALSTGMVLQAPAIRPVSLFAIYPSNMSSQKPVLLAHCNSNDPALVLHGSCLVNLLPQFVVVIIQLINFSHVTVAQATR